MPLNKLIIRLAAQARRALLLAVLTLVFAWPIRYASSEIDFNKLADTAARLHSSHTVKDVEDLTLLMEQLKSADDKEKLRQINDYFNRHIRQFDEDINIWGKSDYWATPLESLGKQRGDCEDYSIAKYLFLKQLLPDDRLRLTYVRAQIGGPHSKIFLAHMVLSYYDTPAAEPLILDNLISDIRPASRRKDLRPIFSFNSEGLWVGMDKEDKGNSAGHLSRWRDVLKRARDEGID